MLGLFLDIDKQGTGDDLGISSKPLEPAPVGGSQNGAGGQFSTTLGFTHVVNRDQLSVGARPAKANLSADESFCSSGIVSLIMWTRVPYRGPSRN